MEDEGDTARVGAVAALRRDRLRNIMLLTHIAAYPDACAVHHVARGSRTATLALLDVAASDYDRATYPAMRYAALVSSDHPDLTSTLLTHVPRDAPVVFKLSSDDDRDAVSASFQLERKLRFISYTGGGHHKPDPEVEVTTTPPDAVFALFASQGHARDWLEPLLDGDRAFVCALAEDDGIAAACFAFENDADVWEIGGVVTTPARRRNGLGARVVRTALAGLSARRLTVRYQVHEDNVASIRLAESLGLRRFLTITHYVSTPAPARA